MTYTALQKFGNALENGVLDNIGHHGPVPSSSIGLRLGDWGDHSMTDMMPADCFLSK